MRYTPGQLRDALGLPQETYRHWKKAIAPLRLERGHSPCFTAGDLVAVAALQRLTSDCGLRVSAMSGAAEALFRVCNTSAWPALERGTLVIGVRQGTVRLQPETTEVVAHEPQILLPLRGIVGRLRAQLVAAADGANDQGALLLPPTALTIPSHGAVSRGGT